MFSGFFIRKTSVLRRAHQVSVFLLVAPSASAELKIYKKENEKEEQKMNVVDVLRIIYLSIGIVVLILLGAYSIFDSVSCKKQLNTDCKDFDKPFDDEDLQSMDETELKKLRHFKMAFDYKQRNMKKDDNADTPAS